MGRLDKAMRPTGARITTSGATLGAAGGGTTCTCANRDGDRFTAAGRTRASRCHSVKVECGTPTRAQ